MPRLTVLEGGRQPGRRPGAGGRHAALWAAHQRALSLARCIETHHAQLVVFLHGAGYGTQEADGVLQALRNYQADVNQAGAVLKQLSSELGRLLNAP